MAKTQLTAGAGAAAIRFSPEMFPTDRLYGVHDDPHVRILLFEAGEKAAIVAYELVNGDSILDLTKETVSEICNVPRKNVWVHVTHAITTPHTPGGPEKVPGIMNPFGPPGAGGPPRKEGEQKPPMGPRMDPDGAKKKSLFLKAVTKALIEAANQARDSFRPEKRRVWRPPGRKGRKKK